MTLNGGKMSGATKIITINTSLEKFYAVICDIEKYPEFIPEMEKVKILSMDDKKAEINYEIKLMGMKMNYTLKHNFIKPTEMNWSFVKASKFIKNNEGSWKLKAIDDNTVEAEYHVELKLGRLVPKKVENTLAAASLPTLMKQFKERAESLN